MKKHLLIGALALALTPAAANAVDIFVRFGPPLPPREVVVMREYPMRHRGEVWVPGYYRWTGHKYRWNKGRWMRPPRHGAIWAPGYWQPRRGGYVFVEGYWR